VSKLGNLFDGGVTLTTLLVTFFAYIPSVHFTDWIEIRYLLVLRLLRLLRLVGAIHQAHGSRAQPTEGTLASWPPLLLDARANNSCCRCA
jgi:hypothetical protein